MFGRDDDAQPETGRTQPTAPVRWECRCQQPPVILATYDADGRIHIKARHRYWHVHGAVQTVCPRCGAEHALDLRVGSRGSEVGSTAERMPG